MAEGIPIVDFAVGSVGVEEEAINKDDLKKAGEAILHAFRKIGFCYVTNHGVQESFLEQFRQSSKEFFKLPTSFKEKFRRVFGKTDYCGWVGVEEEALNPERPGDIRESFNTIPRMTWESWPDNVVPGFRRDCDQFFHTSVALATRILKAIAMGLGLPEDNDIIRCHSLINRPGNVTQVRTSNYPELNQGKDLRENQVRLGEHIDLGSISMVFQDMTGGLEVCNRKGEWVPATPIPGTVLVNVGAVLQRWTADDCIATKHRVVLIPCGEKEETAPARQSLILFVHTDDEAVIRCLDGSNKYPPVVSEKWMTEEAYTILKKPEVV